MTNVCDVKLAQELGGDEGKAHKVIEDIKARAKSRFDADPSKPVSVYEQEEMNLFIKGFEEEEGRFQRQLEVTGQARQDGMRLMNAYVESGKDRAQALEATVITHVDAGQQAGDAAQALFVHDLEQAGVYGQYVGSINDFDAERDILVEIGELSKPDGKPGVTGNGFAKVIAETFNKHTRPLRNELKQMGLKVLDLQGWMMRQTWDSEKVMARTMNNPEVFIDDVVNSLDKIGETPVSQMSPDDVRKAINDFYLEVIEGRRLEEVGLSVKDMKLERETYAVRQAHHRTLHFKSPEDTLRIMKLYGNGDVSSVLAETVRDLGKRVKMTEDLGVNPRNTVAYWSQKAMEGATTKEVVAIRQNKAEKYLNMIDGYEQNYGAVPPKIQMIDSILKNAMRSAYLVGVSISSITDLGTMSEAQMRIGADVGMRVASRLKIMFGGVDEKTRRIMATVAETNSSWALGTLYRRNTMPGFLAMLHNGTLWVNNKTMKWQLLNWFTRARKEMMYLTHSQVMARSVDVGFNDLDPYVQRGLLRGGITESDWDAIRGVKDVVYKDGEMHLLDVEKLTPKLQRKLLAAASDFISEAVITPTARQRYLMSGGAPVGSWTQLLTSNLTFLYGFPLSLLEKGFGRQAERYGAVSWEMGRFIAQLSFYGMISVYLKDLLSGRDRDYTDPAVATQFALEGFIVGGGASIYGEIALRYSGAQGKLNQALFGEDSKVHMPTSAASNLKDLIANGGLPFAFDVAEKTGNAAWKLANGKVEEAAGTMIKLAKNNLPFVRFPIARPVMDEYVWGPLLEMTDPGYMDAEERKWKRRTGGHHFLAGSNN